MTTRNNHFNISTDREISSGKDDRLDRKRFADSLANGIGRWKNKDSLVVGLFGSWGSGKTSIKNMILETLREKDDCPEIVEFNPWQLADRDQLNSAFFQEIGIALGRPDSSHEHKKASSKFILYGAYLKTGAYLFQGTRRFTIWVIRFILGLAIIVGFWIDLASMGLIAPWLKLVVGGVLLISIFSEKISGWLAGLFEHLASIQAAKSQSQEKSLEERKRDVSALLEKIQNPLLIIIDDVDRLTNDEIRSLFKLVKANADFPNLIYLILCDREVVEESLDKLTPGRGKEFLKKNHTGSI